MTDLDICICTFRRPGVADTIRSVLAQEVPEGFALRVIVVDNDDEPTARPLVEDLSRDTPLRLLYIHHPGRKHIGGPQRSPRRGDRALHGLPRR